MKLSHCVAVAFSMLAASSEAQLTYQLVVGPSPTIVAADPIGDIGAVEAYPTVVCDDTGISSTITTKALSPQLNLYHSYRQIRPISATWRVTWSTEEPMPPQDPPRGLTIAWSRTFVKSYGEIVPTGNTEGLLAGVTICGNNGPSGREYEVTLPGEWRSGFLRGAVGNAPITIGNPFQGIQPISGAYVPIEPTNWIPVSGLSHSWYTNISLTTFGMSTWVEGFGEASDQGRVESYSEMETTGELSWFGHVPTLFPAFKLHIAQSDYPNNDDYTGPRVAFIQYGASSEGGLISSYRSFVYPGDTVVMGPPPFNGAGSYNLLISSASSLAKLYSVTTSTNANPTTTITYVPVLGDIDQDGEIGPSDYSLISASWGGSIDDWSWHKLIFPDTVGSPFDCDLDCDGEVGPSDASILASNFGEASDQLP